MEETSSRTAGVARWRQIQEALAEDIFAGKLSGRLPNETALAEQFCVNRHTVRQAVKALAEQGIVEIKHGSGTFVCDEFIDYKLGRRTRLAHSVTTARRAGKSKLLSWSPVPATAEIAGLLSLPARAKVLQVDSLDVVDGKVIGVCTQYFPLPRFEGFGEVYQRTGKTHLALAEFEVHQFQRKLSRISARLSSEEVARQLAQPVSLPILYVETVYVDQDGQPVEYGISRFSSTAVQLVIEPE